MAEILEEDYFDFCSENFNTNTTFDESFFRLVEKYQIKLWPACDEEVEIRRLRRMCAYIYALFFGNDLVPSDDDFRVQVLIELITCSFVCGHGDAEDTASKWAENHLPKDKQDSLSDRMLWRLP